MALTLLQKPEDLPERVQDAPVPVPDSVNKDHLNVPDPSQPSQPHSAHDEDLIQPLHSFALSLTMIMVSEIGDKTFLVAALMAMKHDRMVVFSAAFAALLIMTVLSAILGHAVPTLIPKRLTSFMAAILFFIFGARLLREGFAMSADDGVAEEMQEVERELAEKEKEKDAYSLEMGVGVGNRKSRSMNRFPAPPRSPSASPNRSPSPSARGATTVVQGLENLVSLLLSPAWVQTFVMTFLGEWGDRSQIATIAMAAGQDYWWVTLGAMVGHFVCTGIAVLGGRAIAGRVSMKKGMYLQPISLAARVTDTLRSYYRRRRCVPSLWRYLPVRIHLLIDEHGQQADNRQPKTPRTALHGGFLFYLL